MSSFSVLLVRRLFGGTGNDKNKQIAKDLISIHKCDTSLIGEGAKTRILQTDSK